MKKFMILESIDKAYRFGLHLEETEVGIVGIVNFHFVMKGEYEMLLTDCMGENFYTKMQDNPYSFSLPESFTISGIIMADIFQNGSLVASGVSGGGENLKDYQKFLKSTEDYVVKEDLTQKTDAEYLDEADYYIKKAKSMYHETVNTPRNLFKKPKTTFFDTIKQDFNLLYSVGNDDHLLCKKFKNSKWKKVDISGEVYILGKIYAGSVASEEEQPSFIALAIPTTYENSVKEKPLGDLAKFYHANIYDNFGFLVLVESAVSGRVVNL